MAVMEFLEMIFSGSSHSGNRCIFDGRFVCAKWDSCLKAYFNLKYFVFTKIVLSLGLPILIKGKLSCGFTPMELFS